MIFFYLLISVMPLTQHPLWGRLVGQLTVIKYLGAGCLLYAVLHIAVRQKVPPLLSTWQARLFCLFYLIVTMSYFSNRSPSSHWELSPFMSYTSFLALFLITLAIVDTLERLRWVLLVTVGSVALASLYVLREWQKYHNVYMNFRPGWVVGDPNYFTVSALCAIPMAFYLMLEKRTRVERLFCFACLTIILVAVTLGASRGGFLGLIVAFAYIVWHSRRRLRNLGLVAALLLPITLLAPSSPVYRLSNPDYGDREAEQNRLVVWASGLRMIEEKPLQGVGLGNFKETVGEYQESGDAVESVAHNTYIEIAAEMGLPALLVFMGVMGFGYTNLGRIRRSTYERGSALPHQAALGLQAALVGSSVAIFFVSGQYQKLLWLVVFLSMSLPTLQHEGDRAHDDARRASTGKDTADGAPDTWGEDTVELDHNLTSRQRA
jgi:O-antigen ligase